MEPDTVHLRTDSLRLRPSTQRNRLLSVILFLFSASMSLPFFAPPAWGAEEDRILEQSGIRYPDGFDVNTVGETQGRAFSFIQTEKGVARFSLLTDKETYIVLASPSWYWSDLGVKITDGQEIRVIGSKTLGRDGNLYIIAQEIKLLGSGRSLVLRGKDGSPLWKSPGFGPMDRQGGFGPSSGSSGRGGFGGAGRGRR